MPIKVIAYSCEYKCGYKVQTKKSRVVEHEERCYYNPANKSCVTCKHFDSYMDSNGMEDTPQLHTWRENVCGLELMYDNQLRTGCEGHEVKGV